MHNLLIYSLINIKVVFNFALLMNNAAINSLLKNAMCSLTELPGYFFCLYCFAVMPAISEHSHFSHS